MKIKFSWNKTRSFLYFLQQNPFFLHSSFKTHLYKISIINVLHPFRRLGVNVKTTYETGQTHKIKKESEKIINE